MASDAVGTELISRIVGYKITAGDFSNTTPNLPQRIAIIGEANTANQSGLSTEPQTITTLRQAGEAFGYGSPIYQAMRILRPVFGDGVGGIPTVVYPQAQPGGSTAEVQTITVTGTATAAGVHTVQVSGRTLLDGDSYDVQIAVGDTPTIVATKIVTTLTAVLAAPVTATSTLGVVTATSKWQGLTAADIHIQVNTNDNALGLTYAVAQTTAGSGTPPVTASLALFGNEWNTIVVNCYGLTSDTLMNELEAFNGIPDPTTPTGRYSGTIMRPFIALSGSTEDEDTTETDSRRTQVTIAVCPAPRSNGMPLEAAANMAALFARIAQDSPHRDVAGLSYPDMPTPSVIGPMATYVNRDLYVKQGNSTVDLVNGAYQVQDFVTTYHPSGEIVPQFRYSRNLMIDFNIRYSYFLLEQLNVVDKAITNDEDIITVNNTIKPKQWRAIIAQMFDDLSMRALIADPAFSIQSTVVNLSGINPDRLETFFRYKRTGVARISATTAEAGFNFGN